MVMAAERDPADALRVELSNWVPLRQAAAEVGCTGGYMRRLLVSGDKRLIGDKPVGREWVIHRSCLPSFAQLLSSRSKGKRPSKAKRKPRRRST